MMDLLNAEEYDGSRRYVHVEYMWPMRKEFWEKILIPTLSFREGAEIPHPNPLLQRGSRNIAVLETNATGQFADLLQQQFGVIIDQRFCKANGRAFYREEVREWISKLFILT